LERTVQGQAVRTSSILAVAALASLYAGSASTQTPPAPFKAREVVGGTTTLPVTRVEAAPEPTGPSWKPTAYDAMGPLKVLRESGGAACTIFRPSTIPDRAPIILWGNGTSQMPDTYGPILKTLASNGFVVAAANTFNAGSGADMLGCLDWLTQQNAEAGGPYSGKLDLTKVGATGHSQGGGGALMAGRDPRVKTTAPIMPATQGPRYAGVRFDEHGPILLLSGGADNVAGPVTQQKPVFDSAGQPVFWATLANAGHLVPMHAGGVFPGIVTAWFRYQLMGDQKAGQMFVGDTCGYCVAADWTVKRKGAL
jgi:hypothetical protein